MFIISFYVFFSGYNISRYGLKYVGKGLTNDFLFWVFISLSWIFLIIFRLIKMINLFYKGNKCNGIIHKITQDKYKMWIIEFGYTYKEEYYYNKVNIFMCKNKKHFKIGTLIEVLINSKDNSNIMVNDFYLK
jgi:hypothetical protein